MTDSGDHVYRVRAGQEVVVERFRPEHAEGVVGCFRRVYGDGYPIKTYYDPRRLIEENEALRTISVVARTLGGEVVGHVSLFHSDPCNLKIYESGSGLVLPEYRNTAKLFTRMAYLTEDIGRQLGIHGIYGEPVCNHPYSQKLIHNWNLVTTALEVDLMPAAAYTQEKSAPGRVSAFWAFKTLAPDPHTVHIPRVYKAFFDHAYAILDDERRLEPARGTLPESVSTRIEPQVFDFARVVRMAVRRLGRDFSAALAAAEQEAKQQGVVCFQVWLSLADPWVGEAVDILRGQGYFLGGLLTRWFQTDAVLMQKLLDPPCWDDIVVVYDEDRFILAAVRNDWQVITRSSQPSAS